MLHELIYTSAAHTFDGSGYGVVGRTPGFPPVLEKFVRQISHYDFLTSPDDNSAGENPPAFSHLIVNGGGQRWHVLSRIGFGGYDYSNRRVFLAHHVVVADHDALAGNPARLMQESALFSETWSGDAREIAPRDIRRRLAPPAGAAAWESLTGDRNWSRAWLEKVRTNAGETCYVVAPANADVLTLFSEALALLSDAEAWNATFSTYLSAGRAPAEIGWGALIEGTPAAAQILARYPNRALRLTRSLGRAPVVAAAGHRGPARPVRGAVDEDDDIVMVRSPGRDDLGAWHGKSESYNPATPEIGR